MVFNSMVSSKRGAVFIEGALIFPMIILIVATIVTYTQANYDKACQQAKIHNDLRAETMIGDIIDRDECEFVRLLDRLAEVK